jgi:UDP-N-acetylglucosamine--N-acetylmuramyl-(pentapeptide) pyrophosphoryl-undecaprenol N-acetylglucosamine transferase
MTRHRIVLSGGGTGGHIYPTLAVAEQLQLDPEVESILYVGACGKPEEQLAKEKGLDFVGLPASGLPRKFSGKLLIWPFVMGKAVLEARKALGLFRPTVALGCGGYASAPPLVAARLLGIPYAVHEPDAFPGLANRLLAGAADLVSVGMEGAARNLRSSRGKIIINGNPVRANFVKPMARDAACAVLGLSPALKTVVVTGGSQGAKAINDALVLSLPQLLESSPPIQIIHQSGERNIEELRQRLDRGILDNPRYLVRDYFADLSLPYAASDLAVCRSGAITSAELKAMGIPALFIPYPFAAADHQRHNAEFLASRGAAQVLPQDQVTGFSLSENISRLLSDGECIKSMKEAMLSLAKPRAASDLADQIRELSSAFQARRHYEAKQLN